MLQVVASRLAGEADNFSICSSEPQECVETVTPTHKAEACDKKIADDDVFKDSPSESMEKSPAKRERCGSTKSLKHRSSVRRSPLAKANLQKKGSLMRGRPNTIRTGLPSPYRQPGSANSATSHHVVNITNPSSSNDAQDEESFKNCLNRLTNEPMETDPVTQKSSQDKISSNTVDSELSNLMDINSLSDSRPIRKLRRKSVSTPDFTSSKKRLLRKSVSSCQITSYTGAKFAPLSKGTAEILINIGEMVESKKTKADDNSRTTRFQSESPIKWTCGEKFLDEKLHFQENEDESTTKRESVLRIQRDNAGNVRANVNKINDITSLTTDPKIEFKTPIGIIVPRTPRRRSKRGQKIPVRIPSVFVRNSGVSNSLRNRYHNHELNRKASIRGEPTLPLTSFVKQASLDSSCKMYHSSMSPSNMSEIGKSPLRDSNIANIKMGSQK